jgi:ABC-type transport system involved in multi-copper enzyme maturation permease subunit
MRALIWKEFRLCWPILLVGCALLALPYAAVLTNGSGFTRDFWRRMGSGGFFASVSTVVLTLILLGGNAIAGERNDRSAEFMAYLPVSRARNLVSKLVWPMMAVLFAIAVNLIAASIAVAFGDAPYRYPLSTAVTDGSLLWVANLGGLCFSVAWLGSALLRSPTFAVAGGILAPVIVSFATMLIAKCFPPPQVRHPDQIVWSMLAIVVPLIACSCFFAGCRIYLRRVEP